MSARAAGPHPLKPMPVRSMPVRSTLVLAALLASLAAGAARAQTPPPVVLDALQDDWSGVPARLTDPADAPAPYADVRSVRVRHDATAVYVALELERPVALQGMRGTLLLLLDTDGNTGTGTRRHGLRGTDVAIEFSGRGDPRRGRSGIWLSTRAAPARPVMANTAGVVVAPSHAARWFEVRIPRTGVSFGGRMAGRLVSLNDRDRVVDSTSVFTADLGNPPARPASRGRAAADPLIRAPGTDFRVVSWNVGRDAFFSLDTTYRAILRVLEPDVVMLDEVPGDRNLARVEAALNGPVPGERPWRAFHGTSGGTQRGVIAVRGPAPPRGAPAFAGVVRYPDSARALLRRLDANSRNRDTLYHQRTGVPVTGAVVEIGGRRLLAVTVDLESAGTPGDDRDRLRIIEARVIRDALAAAVRADSVDGVLVTGDLNLVASPDPLDILAAGPDVDGSPLYVPLPLRLDDASAATWENPGEPFTPGRLDFVLVGDAALAVTGGFVFRAGDLTPRWLAEHGLTAETSSVTDHLPVVTDLRWVNPRP